MSNFILDALGLFRRKRIIKSVKDSDFIMLASTNVGNRSRETQGQMRSQLIRATDLLSGKGIFGSTYFVAPEGEDSTAKVGSLTNPWKTISAARDQAVIDGLPSSLIYVWPGVYDETELQYQNGKMYLSAGVLLQPSAKINGSTGLVNIVSINQVEKEFRFLGNWASYLEVGKKFEILGGGAKDGKYTIVSAVNSGGNTTVVVKETIPDAIISGYLRNTEPIFILGADPLNAPVSSYSTKFDLYGEGDINIVESADGDWSKGIASAFGDSEFYGEAVEWKMQQGVMLEALDNAIMNFNGSLIEHYGPNNGGYVCTARDSSQTTFNFDEVKCSASWAFYVRKGNTTDFSGTCIITANKVTQTGSFQVIACSDMITGARFIVNSPIIDCQNYVLNFNNILGGELIFNGNMFSTGAAGNGLVGQNMSGGKIVVNGNVTTETGTTCLTIGGMTGGEIYINGDQICTNGNDSYLLNVPSGSGHRLRLNGSVENTNGGALCTGISKGGNDLVIENLKIISDGDSITAAVAQDINVIHSLACDKALNANVTNVVVGSNVIIDANII